MINLEGQKKWAVLQRFEHRVIAIIMTWLIFQAESAEHKMETVEKTKAH